MNRFGSSDLALSARTDVQSRHHRALRWHGNPVQAALSVVAVLALLGLPFLKIAPNRLVSGEPFFFWALLQGPSTPLAMLQLGALAALVTTSLLRPGRVLAGLVAAASIGSIAGLLWLAGDQARLVAQTASPLARTSLGGAFWLALLLLGLIALDALQRLRLAAGPRAAMALLVLSLLIGLLATGAADSLSIMKEYANRSEAFGTAIKRHLQIVALALLPSLLIGLPLGWAARRHARFAAAVFPVLNVIQTIPSIALFGLLMAPLAWLAAAWPALGRAGISGVGLAPAVFALVLYSLLLVVRGTLAGLEQVPGNLRDAARGVGMGEGALFWQVDVPLAAPVVLAGVRTAAVQSVGLAAVTALIGAGGLGSILFEGLFSSAEDLVLLAVVPIVLLGVAVDAVFAVLIGLAQRRAAGAA
jgi:osmoprotectant transport system permease protein